MADLTGTSTNKEDKSSPASNDLWTAMVSKEADKESEGHTALVSKEADKESEGPGLPKSGMYLAPMGNLCAVVNENLKNCDVCKDTPLVLELDRRVGFASNWKLSCRSCTLEDEKLRQSVCHLKRCFNLSTDKEERREHSQNISRKKAKQIKRRAKRLTRYISSPLMTPSTEDKQREVMDYSVNVRSIISSFYIGTGGQDIGLVNSVQGLEGSTNWEQSFTRYSKVICDAILKVTDEVIREALKEEITLTIAD